VETVDRLCWKPIKCSAGIAFEFGVYRYGLQQRLSPRTPLARLFWPRARIVVTSETVQLFNAATSQRDAVLGLLEDGVPPWATPAQSG